MRSDHRLIVSRRKLEGPASAVGRSELDLSQRRTATRIGVDYRTYLNWERGRTQPVSGHFRPVVAFLGYDPLPAPTTLRERVEAKRRALGATAYQIAAYLGWDSGTLLQYLNRVRRLPSARAGALEAFLRADEADLSAIHLLPRRRETNERLRRDT